MNDMTTKTVTGGPADSGPDLDEFLGVSPARPGRRRAFLALGALVVGVILYFLFQQFGGAAEAAYATEQVRRGSLTVTVSATGNLQPTNQVDVGSEQSGLITNVYVENNDQVVRGQPLARLDTARLIDTIRQNEASVAAAQAQVAQANATQVQARANLARLEQVHRLSGGKVPSMVELESGRAESQRAVAAVRAAQAQVTQARAVLATSQTNLSKATIYSPVTGVVLSRQVDPGQTVAASFSAPVLFVIAEDLSQMKLEVKVDEADVGQVKAGQRATFAVDAYPGRVFPAQILRVDVGANASDGAASTSGTAAAGNVVAYTADLSVQNPELILRPGMTATADIQTAQARNQLLVPNAALRFSPEREARGGNGKGGGVTDVLLPRRGFGGNRPERQVGIGRGSQQRIYVLGENGEPRAIQVTTGATDGSRTVVSGKDLAPGMKVITGRLAAPE
ncbi:efflux RND transporter periplasmic adaptor subunit [Sphingosinicella rhizophila]|uniref:Efflux RND transporter periplasmic adaptor subunit n=1 Tax=Sphingosinicella rhizophila TaxID=3050082 RepID=A0ABU3Q7V1_9SPHN|nr:efflux RND transporter periplasmic adaptor subunit [Sphingosinicella sp. GR2756]MDT9599372.1 efflux RND transporter periplasmic adaptor subunit [Sphingosinicella sp. GR2756]